MNRLLPLIAAAFALAPLQAGSDTAPAHEQRLAEGVYAAGFADQFRSANCGWVTRADDTLLIDLPRGLDIKEFLAHVAQTGRKPPKALVLTHAEVSDLPVVDELLKNGIQRVYLSPATLKSLVPAEAKAGATPLASQANSVKRACEAIAEKRSLGDTSVTIEFLPHDEIANRGAAAVALPQQKILFAGPLVINGPRAPLPGTDTQRWQAALRKLAPSQPAMVVPGYGSWGTDGLLDRQERFLTELRRQVGYEVAQGRSLELTQAETRLPADYLVWMPYDTPLAEDVAHVYQELTVPAAPFNGRLPQPHDKRAQALVLIGDQPHEPGHIELGLRGVFEATDVVPHFTVDVRALSAESLAKVSLLVILRDGLQRPEPGGKADYVWMTPEQEQAVEEFVHQGGGFLNLHNSMGLYPENGRYLNLVGGRYVGHGPLERFRVEVVDPNHPVTRGVRNFSVADEQHTPPVDAKKVHLLLQNRSDSGQTAAAGWVYEPGKGRLCHLANGHTRESLLHPMYQRLMRNAVWWCLKRDPAEPK